MSDWKDKAEADWKATVQDWSRAANKGDEWLAHLLNMEDSDAADMRAFYDRERRRDARKRALRLGWRIIKGILVCIGILAIAAFCAFLWLFPGGLP